MQQRCTENNKIPPHHCILLILMGNTSSTLQAASLTSDEHALTIKLPVRPSVWTRCCVALKSGCAHHPPPSTVYVPLGDIKLPIHFAHAEEVLQAARHAGGSGRSIRPVGGVIPASPDRPAVVFHILDGRNTLAISTHSGHPYGLILVQVASGASTLQEVDAAVKAWRSRREQRQRGAFALQQQHTLEQCVVCMTPIAPISFHWRCPHCSVSLHMPCWKQWVVAHVGGGDRCPHCMQYVVSGDVHQGRNEEDRTVRTSTTGRTHRIAPPSSSSNPIYLEQTPEYNHDTSQDTQYITAPSTPSPPPAATTRFLTPPSGGVGAQGMDSNNSNNMHNSNNIQSSIQNTSTTVSNTAPQWYTRDAHTQGLGQNTTGSSTVPERWMSEGSAVTEIPEIQVGQVPTQDGRIGSFAEEPLSLPSEGPSSLAEDTLPLPQGAASHVAEQQQ